MSLTDQLNPQQKLAVETTDGPVLILAGAGSGKTRVLTHRIAYLLEQKITTSENILAVTFTNKAANEMKERVGSLLGKNQNISWIGTFHSICVRILRKEAPHIGISNNFTIYDSTDSLDTVKEAMDRLNISKKDFNPYAVRSFISSAKNELINSKDYQKIVEGYFMEKVGEIYPVYQQILKENQELDFDDLIMVTNQLFKMNPEILKKYKMIFQYINVDEYQDTNKAQYSLIQKLTDNNICVVGDDDQSIYGFRGANIQNILNFEKDFPHAVVIKLEQNYRSTQTILDAAHSIVTQNKNRRSKKLWTEKGKGEKITLFTADTDTDEANWIAEQCDQLMNNKIALENIAILYRTNAQSRNIEESFLRYGIPYRIVGSIRFYDRKEVKDILAYLRILVNPADDLSLKRIINTPRRGIGPKTFETVLDAAKSLEKNPVEFLIQEANSIESPKVKSFALLIKKLQEQLPNLTLTDFIKYVIDESGYIAFIDDGTMESQGRIENIKELISVAKRYDEIENPDALSQFLEDITLLEEQSLKDEDETNKVTLMTVHSSKGLEFEYVFIIGMEEMLFPHSKSYGDPSDMEEERRLAYVALTRAKLNLYITHAISRIYFGRMESNPVSRFIEDIPISYIEKISSDTKNLDTQFDNYFEDEEEYIQIQVNKGDQVKHPVFGKGTIIDIDDFSISIDFGPVKGIKELALEYAKLEKI